MNTHNFDWRIPIAVVVASALLFMASSASLLWSDPVVQDAAPLPTDTREPNQMDFAPRTGQPTTITTPLVTRWVTYPAPSETATLESAGEGSGSVGDWHPTPQAPGWSTLAPWQTPNPTLICVICTPEP